MIYSREFIEDVIKSMNQEMFEKQLTGQRLDVHSVANVFHAGYCYYYALLLKEIFPEAEIYSSRGHVLVKIGEFFYDSYGCQEDIKLATREQILLMPHLYNTPYSDLGSEDRKLHDLYHSLYYRDPAERLRRFECEEWFIPNLITAMGSVREKYKLPQWEPRADSLFVREEQIINIPKTM